MIRPSAGSSDEDTTPGGGGGRGSPENRGSLEAQQQQQQQIKHGSGREDGSSGSAKRKSTASVSARNAVVGAREGGAPGEGLLESMDVFSLGCVIAEVGVVGEKFFFTWFCALF